MHTFFLNTTGGQENEHIFFTSLDLCGYKKMNTFSFVIENARQKLSVLFGKTNFLYEVTRKIVVKNVCWTRVPIIYRDHECDLYVVILTM